MRPFIGTTGMAAFPNDQCPMANDHGPSTRPKLREVGLGLGHWSLVIATAFTVGLLSRPAQAAEPPPSDPVIMLPPLEVTAALQTTPWRYAEVPGIEILSSCSESTTRAFIQAEHRIEQLFATLVPAEFQVKLAVPKIVVLSEQKRTLSASQDLVVGLGEKEGAGKRPARNATVRFMPNLRLNDFDSVAVFAMIDESAFNPDTLGLTSDHVRFVLDHRTPPLPGWLIDGLTVLATKMTFARDALSFANADWMSPGETEPLRTDDTFPRTLLAMADLLERPRPTEPGPNDAVRRWRAQAALFVRWAFDGDKERRASLWKYVRRVTATPATEAIFQECFGFGYADARDMLSDYLPLALRNPLRHRPESIPDLESYRLRLATDAEVGRLKGDWERLEVAYVRTRFPQYVSRYEEQATRTLTKAHAIDSRDPRLLAVMGLHASDAGDNEKARPLLEAAVYAKVVRPRAYFELARLRFIQAVAKPAGQNGFLNSAQANAVLEPLRSAYTQQPPLAQTYALTAEVWSRSGMRLAQAHFDLLDEGLRTFPGQLNLLYQVAALKMMLNGLLKSGG
jgi:hypothetical protein